MGFSNTNREIIRSVVRLLRRMRINPRVRVIIRKGERVKIRGKTYKANHDVLCVLISRKEDIERFSRLVGFTISRKREKLPGGRNNGDSLGTSDARSADLNHHPTFLESN